MSELLVGNTEVDRVIVEEMQCGCSKRDSRLPSVDLVWRKKAVSDLGLETMEGWGAHPDPALVLTQGDGGRTCHW